MKLHEYQAKEIFKQYGIKVPFGGVASNGEQAKNIASQIIADTGIERVVVKAQVHAGGRGKGYLKNNPSIKGVEIVRGSSKAKEVAEAMLGDKLITIQTGTQGQPINKVLIEQALEIKHEYYVAITVDREKEKGVIIASKEGGGEIEEVAKHSPQKILKEWIDPVVGVMDYQARLLGFKMEMNLETINRFTSILKGLWKIFEEKDATLVEINPLVLTQGGQLLALDSKIVLDDNGLFRHPELVELEDPSQSDPIEIEAKRAGVSYIKLDGNIGCLVNGAGLAMATMDIIKYYGGEPANFLDVGGGASKEMVETAFKIILKDPSVKVIFVNIFGGIMKCDTIANGIIDAVKELGLKVPLVVRLQGTNVELGRKILKESGLKLISVETMAEGAQKAVALANSFA